MDHPSIPSPFAEAAASSPQSICVLGASFKTGNLGVNALAESTIQLLQQRWPQAEIILLASGYEPEQFVLSVNDREVRVRGIPVRFSKRLMLQYHFVWFVVYGVLARLLPWSAAHRRLFARNEYCRALHETHLVVDITGGDSFSDIYGLRRFMLDFLRKWLVLLYRKDLVMLPQTYGPFDRAVSRRLARYILKRSRRIYSRDYAGLEYLGGLLSHDQFDGKVRFAPDVAFVLNPRPPAVLEVDGLDQARTDASTVVGLNVSGLVYYGGYTGRNEFGLAVDYQAVIDTIMELLLRKDDTLVLLVPHVIPTGGYGANVENDLNACLHVFERFSGRYPGRLFVARGRYDHREIKHIIGRCDFFIGTRMHSCIAALSQGIPAVGLAYSRKFKGVFETVGAGELALDMRSTDEEEIVTAVGRAFASRHATAAHLRQTIPRVQEQVMALLESIDS